MLLYDGASHAIGVTRTGTPVSGWMTDLSTDVNAAESNLWKRQNVCEFNGEERTPIFRLETELSTDVNAPKLVLWKIWATPKLKKQDFVNSASSIGLEDFTKTGMLFQYSFDFVQSVLLEVFLGFFIAERRKNIWTAERMARSFQRNRDGN